LFFWRLRFLYVLDSRCSISRLPMTALMVDEGMGIMYRIYRLPTCSWGVFGLECTVRGIVGVEVNSCIFENVTKRASILYRRYKIQEAAIS
jgi:hypothetical protein